MKRFLLGAAAALLTLGLAAVASARADGAPREPPPTSIQWQPVQYHLTPDELARYHRNSELAAEAHRKYAINKWSPRRRWR